jgi:DNA-binding NtrC family response regulator
MALVERRDQKTMTHDRPESGSAADANTVSSAPPAPKLAAPRCYFLLILNETSSVYLLPDSGELLAGRAEDAELRVDDPSASRLHARFVLDKGAVRVRDLGSRNRTWVNGAAIPKDGERSLHSGDVVTIGSMTLILHGAAGERRAATEATAVSPVRVSLGGGVTVLADPAMVRLYELLRRLAKSSLPVLVTGETGTGKENAAQAVHHFSARKDAPLVAINCAAIPENLFESELLGHVRGAFSGALADKVGRFEAASGGTVFLDEVAELPLATQAKLLRVLETGMISPVSSVRDRKVDCRVVAATNRDLQAEMRAGRFREDLYFRLAAATVTLPPLRERPGEVLLLAGHFLREACRKLGQKALELAEPTQKLLLAHPFPGNVRELKNIMEYCAATVTEDHVQPWRLPPRLQSSSAASAPSENSAPAPGDAPASCASFRSIADEVQELERRRMREALQRTQGNQRQAAELIGMPLRTFVTKLKQYGLREK